MRSPGQGRVSERAVLTAALLLATGVFCALAVRMNWPAGRVPLLVGIPTMALLAIQFGIDVRRTADHRDSARVAGAVVLPVLALLGAVYLFGFLVAVPLYAGIAWRRAGAGWPAVFAVSLGAFMLLSVGFDLLLNVQLYPGMIWNGLV